MLRSVIFALLVLVAMLNATPILAQSGDTNSVTKPSTGRTWTLSELDTLSSHKWVWQDPSFKEVVLQTPDSIPDELPRLKKKGACDYPSRALDRQVEADVEVRVLIDKKGKVRAAYVRKDSGHEGMGFEEAAIEVARENRWEPAYLHDESMAFWITYRSQFRLMVTAAGDPVTKLGKWSWWVREETPLPLIESTSAAPSDEPESASETTTDSTIVPFGIESMPVAVKLPSPIYPAEANTLGIETSVWVKVLINRNGKVMAAVVMTPSDRPGYGFEESALTAALDGRWKPVLMRGKPIAAWAAYEIRYLLGTPRQHFKYDK
jgi:TonB family protein